MLRMHLCESSAQSDGDAGEGQPMQGPRHVTRSCTARSTVPATPGACLQQARELTVHPLPAQPLAKLLDDQPTATLQAGRAKGKAGSGRWVGRQARRGRLTGRQAASRGGGGGAAADLGPWRADTGAGRQCTGTGTLQPITTASQHGPRPRPFKPGSAPAAAARRRCP